MVKKDDQNLVQEHAYARLAKVEKEQRRPYKKDKNPGGKGQQIIMVSIFCIILATMLYSIVM